MLKNKVVLMFAFIAGVTASNAQEMQDIFDRKAKVTWLGVDVSAAKLIGDRERWGSTSDVMHVIDGINDLMIKERSKYNVAQAIEKDKVEEALDVAKEHNASLDVSEIFSSDQKDFNHLRENDIVSIVADYDFKGNSGIGVLFIVDSFNKIKPQSSIWITFVNMNTKEVFFAERLIGEPGGSSLRNYWANSIESILIQMRRKEFEMWRKKYYRKF
jgi:hypothetical protein